jgi:hypothetical protein
MTLSAHLFTYYRLTSLSYLLISSPEPLPIVDMNDETRNMLIEAVNKSLLFQNLDMANRLKAVSCMQLQQVKSR